ncbi:Mitochondrial inner membrane protease subunit 2 [Diplonema papillatum]|nr:Mitochondrial inner membrane protease subunit 2 [Diplonema papillatum]
MAWWRRGLETVKDAKYFAVGWLGGNYLAMFFDVCEVKGKSMLPTLSEDEGDRVVVNKYVCPTNGLKKGHVYTFRNPTDAEKTIIKRVVGTAGDRFVSPRHFWQAASSSDVVTVPAGHVWVEGDNALLSEDSRHYGAIPCGLAVGEAAFVMWPPNRIRAVLPSDKESPSLYKPPAFPSDGLWGEYDEYPAAGPLAAEGQPSGGELSRVESAEPASATTLAEAVERPPADDLALHAALQDADRNMPSLVPSHGAAGAALA